jgi:GTP cyclohydrolase I
VNPSQAIQPRRTVPGHLLAHRRPAEHAAEPQLARVAAKFSELLDALGLDRSDPNFAGTEFRVARMYRELFAGLGPGMEPELRTFPNTEGYADLVSLTNISFYSVCAHHFLPFFGAAHIAYLPGDKLVGLSKLARVVDFFARRPQIQERLTQQIAEFLEERLRAAGVMVVLQARHLCIEMRGAAKAGLLTTTTAIRGALTDEHLQRRFLAQLSPTGDPPSPANLARCGNAARGLATPASIRSNGGF